MPSILIVINPEQDRDEWVAIMAGAGLQFHEYDQLPRIFRVEGVTIVTFPLVNHPGYDSIEPADMPVQGAAIETVEVDQELAMSRWGIARAIRRRAPWPTSPGKFPATTHFRCGRDGVGVDIYVIDSGLRTTHLEFGGRATNVYDATGVGPAYFHGTACASMAAGSTAGIARASLIFSFQCLDANNTGTFSAAVSAMDAALGHYNGRASTNRPAVANLSIGGFSASINSAVSVLIDAGMVVVVAAGNNTVDLGVTDQYPAESDADAIVVGGTTACDIPFYLTDSGSNYGTRIDISAPSQSVYQATNTNDADYRTGSGTSYGTAYTTGVVACMLQGYSRLTSRAEVQAVRGFLRDTATTGKVRSTPQQALPDRLLYLSPDTAFETIPGL